MIESLETSKQSVGRIPTDNLVKAFSKSIAETAKFGTIEDRAYRRFLSDQEKGFGPGCEVTLLVEFRDYEATGHPERLLLTGAKARTIFSLAGLLT